MISPSFNLVLIKIRNGSTRLALSINLKTLSKRMEKFMSKNIVPGTCGTVLNVGDGLIPVTLPVERKGIIYHEKKAYMTILKSIIVMSVLFPTYGCTHLYSGDGNYIVDRNYMVASYSIEFPEVPLDREGIYIYNFDNYYTSNSSKRLEFDIEAKNSIVPPLLSTNIKFEVFDKYGGLIGFMSSPLNRSGISTSSGISWSGQCSSFNNSYDYDFRKRIAEDPKNKELIEKYIHKFQISKCTFIPNYFSTSPFYNKDMDGEKIKSFHRYKIVLTVSEPNSMLKDIKGRLVLRSGWK